jgi:superfamily II DNA/RNA helicase
MDLCLDILDLSQLSEHGCHIVVATPGKLEYVLSHSNEVNVKQLEILIMDEADR